MSDEDSKEQENRVVLDQLAGLQEGAVSGIDPTFDDIAKEHRAAAGKQTLRLRYWVSGFVGVMLTLELWGLFLIVVWQGRGHFILNEWAFTAITNGVLLQSFFSFRTIVQHLFPDGKGELLK